MQWVDRQLELLILTFGQNIGQLVKKNCHCEGRMLFPTCGNLLFAYYYVRKILHNRLLSVLSELASEPKAYLLARLIG